MAGQFKDYFVPYTKELIQANKVLLPPPTILNRRTVSLTVISPQEGGAYNLTSVRTSAVRPSVRGQRFLRSVSNWFGTLGQEQVRSEE